ncbi:MAG: restriction endonuclease [Chloroflexi bacterium]|nr:restriction endonuclease [Chloroflexota bacterium]
MDTNVIYCGDNLEVLGKHIDADSADLIYIDPPFNTSRNYEVFWGEAQERRAFEDRFGDAMTYLEWMRPRLRELHRVLKPTGSFYYHCDWHASHYVKVELDRVFGFDNFVNEIIWKRRYGTFSTVHESTKFGSSTDSILFYTKGKNATFHPQYTFTDEAYQKYIKKFFSHTDENGRLYQIDNLANPAPRPNLMYEYKGYKPPKNGWAISREKMEQWDKEGRLHFPDNPDGRIRRKRYLDELKGKPVQNLWDDIEMVSSQSTERLGYPTQKPLALLERIVNASSNEGDVVLDAFCGCGTTLEAAAKLKRKWIGIDFSPTACRVMAERLEKRLGLKEGIDFTLRDMPKTAEQLRKMPPFEFENWAVVALGGIPNKVKVGDYGIDGRLYLADMVKEKKETVGKQTIFEELDRWYPIQVKQMDKVGRPDIDKFQTAMRRDKRLKGYFIAFGFSQDSMQEIKRAQKVEGLDIVPITVDELLGYEKTALS